MIRCQVVWINVIDKGKDCAVLAFYTTDGYIIVGDGEIVYIGDDDEDSCKKIAA